MKRSLLISFGLLVLCGSATTAHAGKIYWTQSATIQRSNLDGSDVEAVISGGGFPVPVGIALDTVGGKMYWTDLVAGVMRSDLDGGNREALVPGLGETRGISLDFATQQMYWIEQTKGADQIRRADFDGTGVETLPISGLENAFGLDIFDGQIYWTDAGDDTLPGSDRIRRANLDGSGVEDLVTAGLQFAFELEIDPLGQKMYWTDGGGLGGPARIQRANLDGSSMEELVPMTTGAYGIALDSIAGKMYWTEIGGDISRANLDGSSVELLLDVPGGGLHGIALLGSQAPPVPEPSTLTLLAIGGIALAFFGRRRTASQNL